MTDYFFTVTLRPNMYRFTADEQFDKTHGELIIMLKILSEKFTLVTELTKSLNIHWHGIIRLGDKKSPFVNIFRGDKQFGFVQLSPITHSEGKVYEYLRKDLANTVKDLNRRPILSDDYKVFSVSDLMKYGTHF